jgi:hypothetical protein
LVETLLRISSPKQCHGKSKGFPVTAQQEEVKMPPTKATSRAAVDPRVILAQIPSDGDVGCYFIAAHTDAAGVPYNLVDVIEAPPGDYPKGLNSPEFKTLASGKTVGDALRLIAGRIDKDLVGLATEAAPATVTPIRKAVKKAPVKKAAAKKAAPRLNKGAATRPVAKKTAGPVRKAGAVKKSSSRRRATAS